jgi:hypothetical protein
MAAYRVTAPYVTLKVKDQAGSWVLSGFYEGAVVSNVEPESLRHHLDTGLVEKVAESEAPEAPAPEVAPDGGPTPPRQTDPKEAWITYAVTVRPEGQSEEDARTEAEGKTKADLVAQYGS